MKDPNQIDNEIKLVQKALESENGEEELRRYLYPLVQSVSENYINEYKKKYKLEITPETMKEVNIASWTHLHLAIKKYSEKIDPMVKKETEMFDFSSYFTWFIKQGIREYLLSSNN